MLQIFIAINGFASAVGEVQISDLNGRLVLKEEAPRDNKGMTLRLPSLAEGFYEVSLFLDNGQRMSKLLLIQR